MFRDVPGSMYVTVSWFEHALGNYSEWSPHCLSESSILVTQDNTYYQTCWPLSNSNAIIFEWCIHYAFWILFFTIYVKNKL